MLQAQLIPYSVSTETALRVVGHKLLLSIGDSTSRVLPVRIESGKYVVEFEDTFSFEPTSLQLITDEVFLKHEVAERFMVEVKKEGSDEIEYSFQRSNNESENLVACAQRSLPSDQYQLYFTFYSAEDQVSESSSLGESEAKENEPYWLVVLLSIVTLLLILIFIKQLRKPSNSSKHVTRLGKFLFDTKNGELIIEEQRIELTSKEAELLALLLQSVNETVERDTILREIWQDEGDYIGRTLDVFISKLRKKLEADPNLKIVNVRGVGYKLIVN